MAANRTVWGIDLGQCALKALRVRLAGDKVEVVDYAYLEHARILSQPDADKQAMIDEAMKKFMAKHDLSKERLVVGVPGQNTLARFTKLPPVDKKKIPDIVRYEAQQQIPFDMDEVVWDYQTFEPVEGATETEVGIFAMRRELMRDHLKFLSNLNLEPMAVQSAPLALYNALKYDGQIGSEAVAILDIGAQNTDLLVVDGNSLWTRNIPIGGNAFTDALVKTFKTSFNKAENLKRTAASSKYARQIFQAMRPVFADLVAEVQRSIGFFTSSRRGVRLNKIIAMGNAFKLPGMQKFLQQNLGMEVVRPANFTKLSLTEAPNPPQLIDQLLTFGVAYGLAVQGLALGTITSNLLPPEIAKQVIWRKKTPWFYGSAACVALSALLAWSRLSMDNRTLQAATTGSAVSVNSEEQANRIVEQGPPADLSPKPYAQTIISAGQKLNSILNEEQGKNAAHQAKAKELADLQEHKVVWPKLLQLVHGALPSTDPELTKAWNEGPGAYTKLIASEPDKYARGKRRQLVIERFESKYSDDVMAEYQSQLKNTSGQSGQQNQQSSSLLPGFFIRIVGRTPNQDRGYINDVFLANLAKGGRDKNNQPIKGMYLDGFRLVRWEKVREAQVSGRSGGGMTGAPTAAPVAGGRGGGEAMSASAAKVDDTVDPVTGESVLDDQEFEILFVAVLGEKPAEPNAPANQ